MKMWDIRSYHLKDLIDTAYRIESEGKNKGKKKFASPTVKARIKSVLNLMFDYALEHEIVDKNYARNFKLDSDIRKEVFHKSLWLCGKSDSVLCIKRTV